jgi:hypothetical protein
MTIVMFMDMAMDTTAMDMVITTAMVIQDTVLLLTRQKPKLKPTKIRQYPCIRPIYLGYHQLYV